MMYIVHYQIFNEYKKDIACEMFSASVTAFQLAYLIKIDYNQFTTFGKSIKITYFSELSEWNILFGLIRPG